MSITTLNTNNLGKGALLPQETVARPTVAVKPVNLLGTTPSGYEAAAQPVNQAELEAAIKKLNDFIAPALQSIEFSIDHESDRMVVKVVDTATKKVLRQLPNEEALKIAKSLDRMQGLVIRQTA